MVDIFDEIAGNTNGSTDLGVIGLSSEPASTLSGDIFDQIAGYSPTEQSETRGVVNQTLRGVGSGLSLVDEFLPQETNSNWFGVTAPHLFGLGPSPEGRQSFPEVFDAVGKDTGAITEDVPQTQLGKLLGNVGENAGSAALFGPAAMAASGVFGGVGGYAGEAAFGPTGRTVGSLVGNLSPAGIRKLGVIKELGEQLGPTVSQFPVFREIFKNAPIEAAVGRALSKSAEDLPAAESALQDAASFIGPKTQLDSLKNTAEIAGDKGLMRAEDAVQNMIPSAPFKSIAEERAAVRAADTLKGYDPQIKPYEVSKGLEQAISKSAGAIEEVESAAWKALPKDAPVNTLIDGVQDDLINAIDNITYSDAVKVEGEAAGLLKKYREANTEGFTSLGVIQELRSRSLEIARDTANATNAADRTAYKVAKAMEEHLRKVVDANAEAGTLPADAADIWSTARNLTRGKMETFGAKNSGTKGLEAVGLKGQSLDNTTLLREGLNSPDKLAAHIRAAAAGGENIKPLYQQALKSELDGAPQSRWRDIIDGKRKQWEQVFTKDELANLDANLADVEAELVKNRGSVTSGSATNPRGNVQKVLNSEKGLAGISSGFQSAATLGAATAGANYGWNKSETVPGGIANALLYGTAGAVLGKGLRSTTNLASAKYDEMLLNALKDPGAALSAINAAKPSGFGKALAEGTTNAAVAGASRGAQSVLNRLLTSTLGEKPKEDSKQTPLAKTLSSVVGIPEASATENITSKSLKLGDDMYKGQPEKKVIEAIKEDPTDHAIALLESSLKPDAKNPKSTAKGIFQLLDGTAKSLGVKDSLDAGDNYDGYLKLKAQAIKAFKDDSPQMIYANHYLGQTVLKKWLDGKSLTDKEAAQVRELKTVLLPRLTKIYNRLLKDQGVTTA